MKEDVKVNVYLIRHGEKSEDGKGLSKNGIRQTELLANRLKRIGMDKIYSSDIPRCKATTEIISRKVKGEIIYSRKLREVEGQVKDNPSKYPGEIGNIKNFWEEVTQGEKGNILVVSSGNVNRILLAIVMGISPKKSRFVQIPSGLTHMEFINKNKTLLVYVNDTSHLPESLKKRQAY